jgi:hypothetical protein
MMEAMAAAAGGCEVRGFQQCLKRYVSVRISQRPAVIIDEQVLPTGTRSPAELQVTFDACHGRIV